MTLKMQRERNIFSSTIIASLTLFAAPFTGTAQVEDSLSFIRSKRMSDEDLLKKKEGRFITGLPDFSSDPVTGFGFGIRSNAYWNGDRTNPLFPYTPYLAKLKANAAYYTSNARELVLSLDVPYYKGSRWRFKVDLKAQQNPANLYFGLTEATLGQLRLPSTTTDGETYSTYAAYDRARKTLRQGGIGEADHVTDALSNRFRETEYMLNLKADYAVGNGKWRIMGGYEIQHLSYATFEGVDADAIHPTTGEEVSAPNGSSLLERDFNSGRISGLNINGKTKRTTNAKRNVQRNRYSLTLRNATLHYRHDPHNSEASLPHIDWQIASRIVFCFCRPIRVLVTCATDKCRRTCNSWSSCWILR